MIYEIVFTPDAEKQFDMLDKIMQKRVTLVLERIRVRPYDFVKKLIGYPYYRLRVGDHRLILDIKNDHLIIIVIEIGHRKSIYK